jgi:hypothetical protein
MPTTFGLGRLVATPAALAALSAVNQDPQTYLNRHAAGDWGEVDPEDRQQNEEALLNGSRLISVYRLSDQTRLWVITEAVGDDGRRASTCVLLPGDY